MLGDVYELPFVRRGLLLVERPKSPDAVLFRLRPDDPLRAFDKRKLVLVICSTVDLQLRKVSVAGWR